ncbi:MAG: inhibitor of apoptosis-promoting Bax1-domain-containing protein [Monoraphidium minutum]|nr:MAG: inhibitor of apoptosis-promoting Bax1-domain-containing protein [Monoraphidium minutum]
MATDFINRATGRTGPLPDGMPFSKIFDLGHIDARIQMHLQKVYATLAVTLLVAAAGVAADISFHIGGLLTGVLAFGALMAVLVMAPTKENLAKRYAALGTFAFCQGVSLGPLVGMALSISPGLPLTAMLLASTVFACFSAAALLAPRRSYLFLGGWLSSAIMGMFALRLGAWMMPRLLGRLTFELELVGGLLVFAGYVIFDSQVIVERCGAGDFDHVKHSVDLFMDFVAVFVRVLILLMRSAEKREEEDRRRRRRRD